MNFQQFEEEDNYYDDDFDNGFDAYKKGSTFSLDKPNGNQVQKQSQRKPIEDPWSSSFQ